LTKGDGPVVRTRALAAAVVLTLRQDRQAAIAQDQARAVKVAEGVQLFASDVSGLQLLPAVFLPGLDWCLPIRLGAQQEFVQAGQMVALVPVRRLVATSVSIRVVAGVHVMFSTPAGVPLFRYFEETGRVEPSRCRHRWSSRTGCAGRRA
jgi:hypothetical protein